MEWLTSLRGQVVALDTAPIIYFIEAHPTYSVVVRPFFQALDSGDFRAVTSTLTILEVLVHPFRVGNAQLAAKYREILIGARNLRSYSVSEDIAEEAARIRAIHNLKTPDAIQFATARIQGASTLLTNDKSFPAIFGITVITLDQVARVGE